MMDFEKIRQQMIDDEARKNKAYRCTSGKLTAGIGRNLESCEFSDEVIELWFKEDYSEVISDLEKIFLDFNKWPEELQHIFFNMRFQLGYGRFRSFEKMIEAAKKMDLIGVEKAMADSKWAMKDTPERAKRLINRVKKLRTG